MTPRRLKNFWSKVEMIPFHECWEWNAARNEKGYGIFGVHGKKVDRAHRISYRIVKGEISKGMFVCHTCDNPGCVNPAHLFLGTNLDNVRDMIAKKRNILPPAKGGWNKYTYDESIINLLGKIPDTEIARLAKVSKYAIQSERKRRGITSLPSQTKFKKGAPHPRWSQREGGVK